MVATPTMATTIQALLIAGARAGRPRTRAMIGTPAGVNGISTSVMTAASAAACRARVLAQVRHRERQEQRRERRVETERVRILEHPADRSAGGGAPDPEHVEDEPRPDEDRPLEPAAPARERPRLVDDRLRLHESPELPAREDRGDGHADRDVARVEEDRREDGCRDRPSRVEHRDATRTARRRRTSSPT